jgi:pSer/pThr/pTyr-binding forkhead associated (FHA) protein
LLSIGENFLVITLGIDDDILLDEKNNNEKSENSLNLKIFSGNIKHGILTFSPKQSPFIIGRSQDCDVIIDDNMLSRFHCSIEYRDDKWYITDGYIDNNNIKKSTNGTWIYAFEDTLIKDKMIFKANNNLFICSFE